MIAPNKPRSASAARVAWALKSGQHIADYVIEQTLGGGGFGITYLARDVHLSLPVALKEYFPAEVACRGADGSVQSLGDGTEDKFQWGLDRFIDEARALATFKHPHIVRVLRYFVANGTAYIVMEYESGRPLKQWYTSHAPVGSATMLQLVLPLLDGLAHIHQAGFLHRDIKPDNIFVRADETPVLIDFGSARNTDSGKDLTTIVSPGYAPFEQYHAQGHQGPWTDLYSLAAVMYWLATGVKPPEAASRVKTDTMAPARHCVSHAQIDVHILEAIDWALQPDEANRPQSVEDFRGRLLDRPARTDHDRAGVTVQTQWAPTVSAPRQESAGAASVRQAAPLQRNLVCSVLSLGIQDFTAHPAQRQAIKLRFARWLSSHLRHLRTDQYTLADRPDGAALCFPGDPEHALREAAMLARAAHELDPMAVQFGLHLGAVRHFHDEQGQTNVTGEGVQIAQRIMSGGSAGVVLASKAFYEVLALISSQRASAFLPVGRKSDRHGGINEVWEVLLDKVPTGSSPTRSNSGSDQSAGHALDEAEVALIEQDLLQLLGPLAPILVRKARKNAVDVQALRDVLAQQIADPAQRESFRTSPSPSRRRSATHSAVQAGPLQPSPDSRRVDRSVSASIQHTHPPSTSVAGTWLPDEASALLERALAHSVGPMAGVLLKQELKRASDYSMLARALSQHIDDAGDRSQFLQTAARLHKP